MARSRDSCRAASSAAGMASALGSNICLTFPAWLPAILP